MSPTPRSTSRRAGLARRRRTSHPPAAFAACGRLLILRPIETTRQTILPCCAFFTSRLLIYGCNPVLMCVPRGKGLGGPLRLSPLPCQPALDGSVAAAAAQALALTGA